MKQLRAGNDRDLTSIESERAGMRRRVLEANEFSEGRRAEVRGWLSRLTDQERLALPHTTKEKLIIESIATAPHFLSGLKEEFWETLVSRVIEDRNYTRLAELAAQEESFARAAAAIRVATADMKRESGLGEREFEQVAA